MTELLLPGITIRLIQHLVAEHCRVPVEAMTSADRRWELAHPRQLAMSLACEFTDKSMSMIGKRFGGRDHSTVWYAIRAVAERDDKDPEVRGDRAALRLMLDHLKPKEIECVGS